MTSVPLASIGDSFAQAAGQGSLLLAVPVALAAGLVSFLSPCVLPLVPGYLSYVTGLTGADLGLGDRRGPSGGSAAPQPGSTREAAVTREPAVTREQTSARPAHRGRLLAGALLFVAGFAVVFVSEGLLFGALGSFLAVHAELITRILGAVTILLGLGFCGLIPWLQRDVRFHKIPAVGLAAAPLLGVLFGLGWTPCTGPTLGVVATLALNEGTAGRGALLMLAYAAGLGVPFVAGALAFRRLLGALSWVRRHHQWVTRIGGGLLVVVGLLLVTGAWGEVIGPMRQWVGGYETAV